MPRARIGRFECDNQYDKAVDCFVMGTTNQMEVKVEEKLKRIEIVNKIIKAISERGRHFFAESGNVAIIFIKNQRLYMLNERNNNEICLRQRYNHAPRGFCHGGTLWGLVSDFKHYIRTGEKCNGKNGYGGLYCPHWGYEESEMKEIFRAFDFKY